MPGQFIDRPNPQPVASSIPDNVSSLIVQLEKTKLDEKTSSGLQHFRRAANYVTAGEKHVKVQAAPGVAVHMLASYDFSA